jgi:hypothetical protein
MPHHIVLKVFPPMITSTGHHKKFLKSEQGSLHSVKLLAVALIRIGFALGSTSHRPFIPVKAQSLMPIKVGAFLGF